MSRMDMAGKDYIYSVLTPGSGSLLGASFRYQPFP